VAGGVAIPRIMSCRAFGYKGEEKKQEARKGKGFRRSQRRLKNANETVAFLDVKWSDFRHKQKILIGWRIGLPQGSACELGGE
jgi:hypothetical protein